MTDFGGRLRQARERRGVSLQQIADVTKISITALEALERDDISKLPGGIFSRAFVRCYALEVGLDPDGTVREFLERFDGEGRTARAVRAHIEAHPAAYLRSDGTSPVGLRLALDESTFENQRRMAAVLLKLVLISIPLAGIILYLSL